MRKAILALALVLFASASAMVPSIGPAAAQTPNIAQPLWPNATFSNVQVPASNFNLDMAFLEYGSGTFSATETHQGTRFYVVYEGELTIMVGDKSASYDAGKSVMVPPGAVTRFSNAGTKSALVYYSGIVPTWAVPNQSTVLAPSSVPEPKVLSAGIVPVKEQRSTINVILQGSVLAPGATSASNHTMNEYNRGLVNEGTATFEYLDGGRVVAPAGQVQTMDQGRAGVAANRGTTRLTLTHTWLSTPGAALTSPASAPATAAAAAPITPPRTGDAGLAATTDTREAVAGLMLMAVVTAAVALYTKRVPRNNGKNSLSQ